MDAEDRHPYTGSTGNRSPHTTGGCIPASLTHHCVLDCWDLARPLVHGRRGWSRAILHRHGPWPTAPLPMFEGCPTIRPFRFWGGGCTCEHLYRAHRDTGPDAQWARRSTTSLENSDPRPVGADQLRSRSPTASGADDALSSHRARDKVSDHAAAGRHGCRARTPFFGEPLSWTRRNAVGRSLLREPRLLDSAGRCDGLGIATVS